MPHELVVNITNKAYDVYIGRPSKWGNPFIDGVHGNREEVIYKFAASLTPEQCKEIRQELKGKILGCYCAPRPCHGDVLASIANSVELDDG